jgi:hypothetical protein
MLEPWRMTYYATCMYLSACEAAWAGWMMAWEPGRKHAR